MVLKCSHTFSESITGRTPITQQIIVLTAVVYYSERYKEKSVKGKDASAKSLQSCLTLRRHRRQPTRLPRPWDSSGKNTGVGCHFLLQCMKVKSESEITQSCPTISDPVDYSLPGSSIHGIFQARVLEWGAIAFSERKAYVGQIPDESKNKFPGVLPSAVTQTCLMPPATSCDNTHEILSTKEAN